MADSCRQSTLLFSIITGIVLLVVGVFGFLVIRSFNSMEEQLSKNESRNVVLSERIESLSQKIEIVGSIARDAEDQARQAAIGRIRAEASKTISEAETRVALKKAESLEVEVSRTRDEVARIKEERNQEMNRLQEALSRIADTRRTALGLVMNLGSDTINFLKPHPDLGHWRSAYTTTLKKRKKMCSMACCSTLPCLFPSRSALKDFSFPIPTFINELSLSAGSSSS